jgi:hypothetical protein
VNARSPGLGRILVPLLGGDGARAVLDAALTSRLAKVEEAAKAAKEEADARPPPRPGS